MMRMVLVIGSEGINLMLGSLPKFAIWIIIITIEIRWNKVIISLIFGPNHSVCAVGIRRGNRKEPDTAVSPEYLGKILISPDIIHIWSSVRISLALEIVKSGGVCEH